MNIIIERRAEIALRSLESNEQQEISKALNIISSVTSNELPQILDLHQVNKSSEENIYEYRVSTGKQKLSLVCSFQRKKCIVEDVVAQDKLERLLLNLTQQ